MPQLPSAPELGPTCGSYRLLEQLAQGGMGRVYRAQHAGTGAIVALKTVIADTPAHLDGIRREVQALADLSHPSVMRILDHGVEDGRPYYAMEFCDGVSLRRTFLRRSASDTVVDDALRSHVTGSLAGATARLGPPPSGVVAAAGSSSKDRNPSGTPSQGDTPGPGHWEAAPPIEPMDLVRALTVFARLAEALAYVHGEGIVHRDLTPDNVLVRDPLPNDPGHGRPVIIDFGLAAQFEGRLRLGMQQARYGLEGTFAYLAPELVGGSVADARADLYGLGCMLFEVLAGRPPFIGLVRQMIRSHVDEAAPRLEQLVAWLPPPLCALVDRMLAKEPRERIGHADEVAAALIELGGVSSTEPRPPHRDFLYRSGFVGREAPLRRLTAHTVLLDEQGGGLVLVAGESGAGKTRLLLELVRDLDRRGVRALTSECRPNASRPLEALHESIRRIADRCRKGGVSEAERIFGERGKVLAVALPEIAELPGQDLHPTPPPLPARAAATRLYAALTETLCEAARDGGLVLVVDDIQWADEHTLGFLNFAQAARSFAASPVLVLGSYRVEEVTSEIEVLLASGADRLELERLPETAIGAMVAEMLGVSAPPEALAGYIADRAEGNPFFVGEYLRTALEAGVVGRLGGGRWRVPESRAALEALPLPRSLRALVAERLDALGPDSRAVLAVLAVLGRENDIALASELAGLPDHRFLRACNELARRHIIEPPSLDRLRLTHDKLLEVGYELLDTARRRALHDAAGTAIERRHGGRNGASIDSVAGTLARHFRGAGRTREAAEYARLAGQASLRAAALVDAVQSFEGALESSESFPRDRDSSEWRFDLMLETYRARMHLYSAADSGMLELCRRAEPLAEQIDDPIRLTTLYSLFSGCHIARGDFEGVVEYSNRALLYAERVQDSRLSLHACLCLSGALVQRGELRGSLERMAPLIAEAERQDLSTELCGAPYPPYVAVCGFTAVGLALRGRRQDAASLVERALDAADRSGSRYAQSLGHVLASWVAYPLGRLDACCEHATLASRLAADNGMPGPEMFSHYAMGVGYALGGHPDEAIPVLEAALQQASVLRYEAFQTEAYYGLAMAHLARGDVDRLEEAAAAGLGRVAAGERKHEPEFQRLLAEVHLRRGRRSDAVEALRRSIHLADAREMPVYGARSRTTLAAVPQMDVDAARRELRVAVDVFRAVGLERELISAEVALSRIGGGGSDGGWRSAPDDRGLDSTLNSRAEDDSLAEPSAVMEMMRAVARIDSVAPPGGPPLAKGEMLAHFQVLSELGRGGMGIVYVAEDTRLRRRVALKVLPASLTGEAQRRRRLIREARAAAAVNHPNIATVYDFGESQGRIYIAMELVAGETLRARMAGRVLPVGEALDVARQVLRGLSAAHAVGLVHRDLKPENVLVSEDGAVKILDFGLAKRVADAGLPTGGVETTLLTREGHILGTPAYMSPEQAVGESVDARSDLFSFGVVLYEMLVGRRPFDGDKPSALVTAILTGQPEVPSTLRPELGEALSSVVMRCLAKDPSQRYRDCASLARALVKVAEM